MGITRSTAYDAIAIRSAERAGIEPATVEAAATRDDARVLRDQGWQEYERMLCDTRTYTLDDVWDWIKVQWGGTCGRSTVHRDRLRLLEPEKRAKFAAMKSQAARDLMVDRGEMDLFGSIREMFGQAIFDALLDYDSETLKGLDPGKFIRLIEVGAKLGKAHAESELLKQKLLEMQDRFDREMERLAACSGSDGPKAITTSDIAAARKRIFGEVA